MTTIRTVDDLGRTTDRIIFTKEEHGLLDTAVEKIVSAYEKAVGIPATKDEVELTDFACCGALWKDGRQGLEAQVNGCCQYWGNYKPQKRIIGYAGI